MGRFFDGALAQPAPEPPTGGDEINPMAPIVPQMTTSLQLTLEQEEALTRRMLVRIGELQDEMGCAMGDNSQLTEGWMWERQKNQLQYDNDWEWRKALGGIFIFSNFSLNLSKRYARLMAAKTTDDLVGTDPFFSCMPTDEGDPELAKEAEWYVQEQMTESNAKRNIRGAQKTALIRNECVVKLSYVNNDTHFRGPGVVAIGPFQYDGPNGAVMFGPGQPIMTPKGHYIYQKDNLFDDPNVQGVWHLEKEPAVSSRYKLEFKYFADLDQTLTGPHNGLCIRELDYRDFLCPLNVESIHDADINVHLYDEQWERLKATFNGFSVSEPYMNAPYLSGEKQAKEEKGEQIATRSQVLKIVNVADVYIRCNPFAGGPNDMGMESEVWGLVDLVQKKLIWYDFLGNHMKKRPFECIPGIEHVQNRWYGVGVFEMLAHKQDYVDTQFNRVNWKSMKASSVRFRVKNAVAEWKAGEKMVFGDDSIYDIEDPRFDSKNPPFFEVPAHEIDEYAMKLIELMVQAGATEVGIVGPDDAAMAGMDSGKLATGIKSLERTGNLLMKFTEADHAEAIADILDQAVDIILEKMDEDELVYKADTGALLNLNREEIRKLRQSVTLLLTRNRSSDTIETMRAVVQLVREYYEALNPFEQYKLRPEYLKWLKALETTDAAKLLDEISKQEADQWKVDSKKPKPIPPKESIATKYGDLERSEQEQVLQQEGIQPAPKTEVAASTAKETKQEVTKAGGIADVQAKAKADHPPPAKPAPKK